MVLPDGSGLVYLGAVLSDLGVMVCTAVSIAVFDCGAPTSCLGDGTEHYCCRCSATMRQRQTTAPVSRLDDLPMFPTRCCSPCIARWSTRNRRYIESFNGRVRDECLNINIFWSLAQVRLVITDWKQDYTHRRRHSSLGYQAPAVYAAACPHR